MKLKIRFKPKIYLSIYTEVHARTLENDILA
jgi:hypothetical protein